MRSTRARSRPRDEKFSSGLVIHGETSYGSGGRNSIFEQFTKSANIFSTRK